MIKIIKRKAKVIKIGKVKIGGNNPIAIQSMAKTKTADIEKTTRQIRELENAGCEVVRLAVKDSLDVRALKEIKRRITIPIVADIHFNWLLAIKAIDNGADKVRLNPGNIYKVAQIREITRAAKINCIPIRIGVNSGSLPNTEHQIPNTKNIAERMIKSALDYIKILEGFKFYDIVVSLKSSDIFDTLEAYRKMAKLCDYPLHLGVTATGPTSAGIIKSSVALGVLLLEGIGDTIRISLTDQPRREVEVAKRLLEVLGLRHFSPEIISCPTCGRCEVDLVKIVSDLEKKLSTIDCQISTRLLKVAVMGCVVNGPGEAREADIGVAFGKKEGLLFKKGKSVRKISSNICADVLLEEIFKAR